MNTRRLQDIVGVVLLGDGITHLIQGRQHIDLWQAWSAPDSFYNHVMKYLRDHPAAYGLLSVGEVALGIVLMRRAERPPVGPASDASAEGTLNEADNRQSRLASVS